MALLRPTTKVEEAARDADIVTKAEKVLAAGQKGLLYCPGSETACTLDNIFTDSKWHGPTSVAPLPLPA